MIADFQGNIHGLTFGQISFSLELRFQLISNLVVDLPEVKIQMFDITARINNLSSELVKQMLADPLWSEPCDDFVWRSSHPVLSWDASHGSLGIFHMLGPLSWKSGRIGSEHNLDRLMPRFNIALGLWVIGAAHLMCDFEQTV